MPLEVADFTSVPRKLKNAGGPKFTFRDLGGEE
jgi:hypothetical protein